MSGRFKIVRFYQNHDLRSRTVRGMTGLTLEQAQAHCNDPETSSRTAKSPTARTRPRRYGAWFDGYREEQ